MFAFFKYYFDRLLIHLHPFYLGIFSKMLKICMKVLVERSSVIRKKLYVPIWGAKLQKK